MTKGEGMTPEEYRAMVEESDAKVYKSQMNAYKEKYLALLKANTELVEENEKLKKDLAETQKIGESRRQECKQLRKQYQHSMGFSDFGYNEDE